VNSTHLLRAVARARWFKIVGCLLVLSGVGLAVGPPLLSLWKALTKARPATSVRHLEPGDAAIDFTLPSLQGGPDVCLKDLLGRKPVVLVFGSLTCELFYARRAELERLYQEHKGRVEFLLVYIREAGHRIDGLEFLLPDGQEALYSTRQLPDDRHGDAVRKALGIARLNLPVVMATHDTRLMTSYAAFPWGLLVLDQSGRVALRVGLPPAEGTDVQAVASWLRSHGA
jgi:hypothetical protein